MHLKPASACFNPRAVSLPSHTRRLNALRASTAVPHHAATRLTPARDAAHLQRGVLLAAQGDDGARVPERTFDL
jgi:hypothetical protein